MSEELDKLKKSISNIKKVLTKKPVAPLPKEKTASPKPLRGFS